MVKANFNHKIIDIRQDSIVSRNQKEVYGLEKLLETTLKCKNEVVAKKARGLLIRLYLKLGKTLKN